VSAVPGGTDLIAVVEKILPEFARACRTHDTPAVIMHQDAFAADYQEEEYRLIPHLNGDKIRWDLWQRGPHRGSSMAR